MSYGPRNIGPIAMPICHVHTYIHGPFILCFIHLFPLFLLLFCFYFNIIVQYQSIFTSSGHSPNQHSMLALCYIFHRRISGGAPYLILLFVKNLTPICSKYCCAPPFEIFWICPSISYHAISMICKSVHVSHNTFTTFYVNATCLSYH